MRRPVRVALAVSAVAAAAAATWRIGGAGSPDRVWAFVAEPPWTAPSRVSLDVSGDDLPGGLWMVSPVTGTTGDPRPGARSVGVHRIPSDFWRNFNAVLGLRDATETYVPTGEVRTVDGGRWFECRRATPARRP